MRYYCATASGDGFWKGSTNSRSNERHKHCRIFIKNNEANHFSVLLSPSTFPGKGADMPDYDRHAPEDDLDIATRVMDTVQRQVGVYRDALLTLRRLRRQYVAHQEFGATQEPTREINTPELLAEYFQENGIPRSLAEAFATEDFAAMGGPMPSDFDVQEMAFRTWDCCCTACCFSCVMATQVTGCTNTFVQ